MLEEIIKAALSSNRIDFAILIMFVVYIMRLNAQREAKYQSIIDNLADNIVTELTTVKSTVEKINDKIK